MDGNSYRTVVTSGFDYVTTGGLADEQLREWLREVKKYDADLLEYGPAPLAPGVRLDADSRTDLHGAYTRWRLRESTPDGVWQTLLVVRSRPDGAPPWVRLEVEQLPAEPGGRSAFARPPRLAAPLLAAIGARDGLAEVSAEPRLIQPAQVPRVVAELCDPERRLPTVVASVADEAEQAAAGLLLGRLAGLAVLYLLGPQAEPEFNRALPHHRVFEGAVRTFLPGVRPDRPADAYRHPLLRGAVRLADRTAAARLLTRLPRRLAVRSPLPAELVDTPALRPRPATEASASELERLRSENTALTQLLDEAGQEEAARLAEIGELRLELREREESGFELAVELEERAEELRRTAARLRDLQRHLVELDQAAVAFREPAGFEAGPVGFEELLGRLGGLDAVRFTGNRRTTAELDAQALGSDWAATAWDALLALQDYAAARRRGGALRDFLHWCRETPPGGHGFPPGKVVRDESPQTAGRRTWRQQRTFPVPAAVDPAGELFMGAHLRIGAGNAKAPRLHFHDDTGHTGLVYVGYLGPHLDNTLHASI
ncbi:hypothetical protein C7C46_08125 [Streptomyces tateyamensis]|uniref:Uncharacterized protein n=1 Tax=Streptomyces tateyamensis TaxID=565073 RepID=A0A2V4PIX0_9ACTN|nr:hypothetical protein [Streptomyces tateyamensis]PYC84036.1 hypothetical protein C7C46_08125 [Streptomyces tateyamensis]